MNSKTKLVLLSFLPATLLLAMTFPSAMTVTPVLAEPSLDTGPAAGGSAGLEGIINNLIDLIQTIAKPIALLGLVGWGVAQFAQPFAPELNQRFQGYSMKLLFGAILVLGGTQIVDWLWGIV